MRSPLQNLSQLIIFHSIKFVTSSLEQVNVGQFTFWYNCSLIPFFFDPGLKFLNLWRFWGVVGKIKYPDARTAVLNITVA